MQTELKDVNILEIYKKWQCLSHMFECFVHSTSFATLRNYPNFELNKVSIELDGQSRTIELDSQSKSILDLVKKHSSPSTLFLIDLPIAKALKHVYFLNKELGIMPVLTIRHINHQYGLVGDHDTISCLINYSYLMNISDPTGFIFVLDSQRYSEFEDDIYKTHFDNQYEITEYDLPPIEMLHEYGYSKAVFIFENSIKEDINEYKDYLMNNDLDIICYDAFEDEEMITNG